MKLFLLLSIVAINGLFAQQDSLIQIANWKNGKAACIVFSFDDWSPGHGEIVVPFFEEQEVPATFFVTTKNSDLGGGWEQMKRAFNNGCEIGNHTITHRNLAELGAEDLQQEIVEAQRVLQENVHPDAGRTIAFPYGTFNIDVLNLVKKNHIGARLANLSYGRAWPYRLTFGKTDYFQLQTFMVRDINTPQLLGRLADQAIQQGGMITFMYHSIYNDSVNDHWFGALDESMLFAQVKEIKKRDGDVWISTFEDAIQYHEEKANTLISVDREESFWKIHLSCSLDSTLFDEEISVEISNVSVENIESVFCEKTKKSIPFWLDEAKKKIYFNALPYESSFIIKFKTR